MSRAKQLHLGWLVEATGKHVASWLDPQTQADAANDIGFFAKMAKTCERGKFDLMFVADTPGAPTKNPLMLSRRGAFMTRFEPVTFLSALAMTTQRLGLGATVSTTFTEPFNVARYFASLDHLSRGRGAWNVVTTVGDHAALNFGLDRLPDHADRYERAREFVQIVMALWDTYEDDAFLRDRAAALYFDPRRFHPIDHRGKYFSVRGALNCARSPQGRPVIIQAGASKDGLTLAAETADATFGAGGDLERASSYYRAIKTRTAEVGRDPDSVKVLQCINLVLGESRQQAEDEFQAMQARVHPDIVRETMSFELEIDLANFPLDRPIPESMLPKTANRHQAYFDHLVRIIKADHPTLQELFSRWTGDVFRGTPVELADMMEHWSTVGAADGFMVSFESMSNGLDVFVDRVVPELQRRGLFRTDYEGTTLRDHLGLSRPPSRYSQTTG
jgi:N-acetyl-S-(2-succino)cysteine monooxygenase